MEFDFNKSNLDALGMKNEECLVDREYYHLPAGQAEYRLFSYVSTLFHNITILDIGTNQGRSAIALSHNDSNHVISYDIEDKIQDKNHRLFTKPNTEFRIKNVLNDITPEFVATGHQNRPVQVVMIDICHYGKVERDIMDKLYACGFRGIILLDDIHHPDFSMRIPMEYLWENIPWRKYDVTSVGHFSGTGLISLMDERITVRITL